MKKIIKRITGAQKTSIRKSVKAVMYNKITEGEYEGGTIVNELIPPGGVPMSTGTKEQEAYLDKRFLPLERDVKVLKEDVKVLKEDVKVLKEDVKVLKSDIKEVKSDIKNIFEMIVSINKKLDAK